MNIKKIYFILLAVLNITFRIVK